MLKQQIVWNQTAPGDFVITDKKLKGSCNSLTASPDILSIPVELYFFVIIINIIIILFIISASCWCC